MSSELDKIINNAYNIFYKENKDYMKKKLELNDIKNDLNIVKHDRESRFKEKLLQNLLDNVEVVNVNENKLLLKRRNKNKETMISIYPYKNVIDADNLSSKPNNNMINKMLLFSSSDNVNIPIQNIDVMAEDLQNKHVNKDIKKFLSNKSLLSVQIGGNFNKNIDTKKFLKNISEEDMKVLLFKLFEA